MSEPISPDVARLIRQYVDDSRFSSSTEVLGFAMTLFVAFEERWHAQIGESLRDAFRSIDDGEGLCLNGSREINAFFDDMMAALRRPSRSQPE